MNKKGMSLIELIVCVTVMSIVMIFLYKLISDIFYEKNNGYYAKNNAEQRVEIINDVELAVNDKTITKVAFTTTSVTISDASGVIETITKDNNTIITNDRKWTMKNATLGTFSCKSDSGTVGSGSITISSSNILVVTCTIPVYTSNDNNNSNNNNVIDDLTFEFITVPEGTHESVIEDDITEEPEVTGIPFSTYIINNATSIVSDVHNSHTSYSYVGQNPHNFVKFNGEIWRVVGVYSENFEGTYKQYVKIIRNDSIGSIAWNTDATFYAGTGSSYITNNWKDSSLQKYLNNDYYNSISNNNMIVKATWYLGGIDGNINDYTAEQLYNYERGSAAFDSNWSSTFSGYIGLPYMSDYAYSTAGGDTTNRTNCLSLSVGKWSYYWLTDPYSPVDCYNNTWYLKAGASGSYIGDDSNITWAINPKSDDYRYAVNMIPTSATILVNFTSVDNSELVRPVLYLKINVDYLSGDGSFENPYQIYLGS